MPVLASRRSCSQVLVVAVCIPKRITPLLLAHSPASSVVGGATGVARPLGSWAAIDARSSRACGPSIHGAVSTSVAGAPEASTTARPRGSDPRSATSAPVLARLLARGRSRSRSPRRTPVRAARGVAATPRAAGLAAIAGILGGEGVYGLAVVSDTTGVTYWIAILVLGIVLLVVGAVRLLGDRQSRLVMFAVAAGLIAAFPLGQLMMLVS